MQVVTEVPSWSFDVLAAELRRNAGDLDTFHEVLAEKLTRSLPTGSVAVKRGGLPLAQNRPLHELKVDLGEWAFSAVRTARGFEHRAARVVRGIALKTDVLTFDEWVDALSRALYEEAAKSERIRRALEQFLIGGADVLGS